MPKFAANLTMLFNEVPFLDRFALAARAGFQAVEFMFPYPWSAADIPKGHAVLTVVDGQVVYRAD